MKIINYDSFIEKINETKSYDYDCTILLFFTGEIMSCEEDTEIEDEDNFYGIFSDLIYFIETQACNLDQKENFKAIINDLVLMSSEKKIDKIDVNYVLFKKSVLKFTEKFNSETITANTLEEQLHKIFGKIDYQFLLKELKNRYDIIFASLNQQ